MIIVPHCSQGWRILRRALSSCTILLAVSACVVQPSIEGGHPLDPLTRREIADAISAIAASGQVNRNTRAAMITLNEPDKQQVLRWRQGDVAPRKAFAVLRVEGKTVEAVVDLATRSLESWTVVPGVQPSIDSAEWANAQRLVKQDSRWRGAMRKRGYTDFDKIFCDSLSAGYFGASGEDNRRLLKMPCYDISNAKTNVYARPIEGVIATVDLDVKKVVNILDTGVVPSRSESHEFDEKSIAALRPPIRPVRTTAPNGWNFRIDGRMIRWQGWSMHLGFDQRFGPVLSLVAFQDEAEKRSILYQAHVSEVFVPYMDPAPNWNFRTYMDAGEYGLGALSSPLAPGLDCPDSAVYFDATLSTPTGGSYRRKRVLCVFERDTAAPLWRHYEALNNAYEGRPATELVVRSIPSIAHYDYVIDWIFAQSGRIKVNIGATGIDAVKAVAVGNIADPRATELTRYGKLVAPGLLAVNHDHYFSIRFDVDVDGPVNRFVRERLTRVSLPKGSRRRSLWRLKEDPLTTEGALSSRDGPQVWRIENSVRTGALGHHPGYQIQGSGPTSLLSPDDWPQRRAAFSSHNIWITARRDGERYAAGAYPNQSKGGDGLPDYVSGERIDQTDLVAWYTIGFHHVPRPEDWPVLSTVWQGVTLRPYGFFDRNPGVGVRR